MKKRTASEAAEPEGGKGMKLGWIVFCAVLLVAAVLIGILAGGKAVLTEKKREWTVGTDILPDDLTEFYWTYATSSYPPEFQRYHFSHRDGAYRFRHEKREGNSWPLGEEDVTVSGTIELTAEQWQTFLSLIEGGLVTRRTEDTSTGRSGPFLYLYWTGDRSGIQEFSFRSCGAEKDFEEFCVGLKDSP